MEQPVKFTLEELQKLVNLLDIATKAGGLAVASEALPLVAKIQEMAKFVDVQEENE
jgi:hypothetical protein